MHPCLILKQKVSKCRVHANLVWRFFIQNIVYVGIISRTKTAKSRLPICLFLPRWQFLASNTVLSPRGPGFRSYLALPTSIHPSPLVPTCNPAVALWSSWKFPPNYSNKTPTSAAERHPFIKHTCKHSHLHTESQVLVYGSHKHHQYTAGTQICFDSIYCIKYKWTLWELTKANTDIFNNTFYACTRQV